LYHFSVRTIILSGIFLALIIIFTHVLAIQTPFIRIGFGFLPLAIYAAAYGPLAGSILGAVSDILGCILFTPGLYFPGFTISSFCSGAIYGFCFYNKSITIKRAAVAFTVSFVIVDMLLNTIWLSILYQKAVFAFAFSRFIKGIIFMPINIFLFYTIYKTLDKTIKKYRNLN
jgi:ECF transporter S component (folate family)